MLADEVAYVLGVDTHADTHTLALVEAASRRSERALTIPASRRGFVFTSPDGRSAKGRRTERPALASVPELTSSTRRAFWS